MNTHRAASEDDQPLSPEDVDSAPTSPCLEVADDLPVPAAMSPAEIDERAQVVDKLRHEGARKTPD